MPVEIKGQQLRIRIIRPKLFKTFYYPRLKKRVKFLTHDIGHWGRLQRIAGKLKRTGKWMTQSWRLNLKDYDTLTMINGQLQSLYRGGNINRKQLLKARHLAKKWWGKHRRY